MRVKALKTFAGAVSMRAGDIKELPKGEALSDLLRCGYVISCDPSESEGAKNEAKRGKHKQRKAGNESGL